MIHQTKLYQEVWFLYHDTIRHGNLTSSYTTIENKDEKEEMLKISVEFLPYDYSSHSVTEYFYLKDLFSSKEELEKALNEKYQNKKRKLYDEIKNKDDLIKYCFNNPVCLCEEYTDWNARNIIRELAKEKFNIELE